MNEYKIEAGMRLVYSADLHGDIDAYQALLALAVETGAQIAIVGGDLLPHAITLKGALTVQRSFVEEALGPLLAGYRARHPGIAVYLLAGNDDWAGAISALDALERAGLAYPLHQRVYRLATSGQDAETLNQESRGRVLGASEAAPDSQARLGGSAAAAAEEAGAALWLAGYACVPLTPFSIKDYERRDDGPLPPFSFAMAYSSANGSIRPTSAAAIAAQPSIAEDLAALAQQSDPRRTIYVCHTPPANTALDQMPQGRHVGSRALRAFIEQQAPPLTLHGHIHEAPQLSGQYAIQLGTTWSINPGHDARRFHAVALDTDDVAGTAEHTVFGRPGDS